MATFERTQDNVPARKLVKRLEQGNAAFEARLALEQLAAGAAPAV
jgi:hypothetical protein